MVFLIKQVIRLSGYEKILRHLKAITLCRLQWMPAESIGINLLDFAYNQHQTI